jgi:hypothetical protein
MQALADWPLIPDFWPIRVNATFVLSPYCIVQRFRPLIEPESRLILSHT